MTIIVSILGGPRYQYNAAGHVGLNLLYVSIIDYYGVGLYSFSVRLYHMA